MRTVIFNGGFQRKITERLLDYGARVIIFSDCNSQTSERKLEELDHHHNLHIFKIDFSENSDFNSQIAQARNLIDPNHTRILPRQEQYLPWYSELSSFFNLTIDKKNLEGIEKILNKTMSRTFLAETAPELTVRTWSYDNFIELKNKVNDDFLITGTSERKVLKPINLWGSKGVYICEDLNSLVNAVNEIGENEKLGNNAWILEEFLDGDQYSIDVIINNDGEKEYLPSVFQATNIDKNNDASIQYSQVPGEVDAKIVESKLDRMISSLDLHGIILHIEFKYNHKTKTTKIIEINPRMGGFRQDLYYYGFGIDYVDKIAKLFMGLDSMSEDILPKKNCRVFYVYADKVGILKSVNIDPIKKLESYATHQVFAKLDTEVGTAQKGYPKIMKITLANEDQEKLDKDYNYFRSNLEKSILTIE